MKSDVVELLKEVALTRSQKAFQTLGVVDIMNFKYATMTDLEKMDMTIIQQEFCRKLWASGSKGHVHSSEDFE